MALFELSLTGSKRSGTASKTTAVSVDFHICSHDLQIEILLIRIRGIISIHSCEDLGGDIEALLLSCRASKDNSKDTSRVLPDRDKLSRPAGTRSLPPFLVSSWMFAPASQRHAHPASNKIESEAVAFKVIPGFLDPAPVQ